MTADRWVATLREASRHFAATRNAGAPAIRVTLQDGESFFLFSAKPIPETELVMLAPFPEDPEDDMIRTGHLPTTPRLIVVSTHFVRKVEILTEAPERHDLGFRAEAEDEAGSG